MKHLKYVILLLIGISLLSCEKKQLKDFMKDAEGRWQLMQISYERGHNSSDSIVKFDDTFLEFMPCNVDNKAGSGNCFAELKSKNGLQLN